VQIVTLNSRKR